MSSDTREELANAPLREILHLLFRQLDSPLTQRATSLGANPSQVLLAALEAGEAPDSVKGLAAALIALLDDNLKILRQRLSVDFAGSLAADITQLADWESTADFLSIANEKAQAEQEIVIAAALLVACGSIEYASYLIETLEADAGALDVDAVIARRMLLHVGAIDGANTDAPSQARAWLLDQSRG
ncbi:MAG: hypothetical protein OXE52_00130 [Chloroflexi bacterium]|nr:hypothetical protein [Chloroflexota bacterium]